MTPARTVSLLTTLIACAALACSRPAAQTRLGKIQTRGSLGCGVDPWVAGFTEVDGSGGYRGLDVDVCRAIAAAIFGTDKVTFIKAGAVADLAKTDAIDIVSRRITWELRREHPYGLLFGPITFYDGQGFLVAKSAGVSTLNDLASKEICVAEGTAYDENLEAFLLREKWAHTKINAGDPHDLAATGASLASGRCAIYTSDLSLLAAIRARLPRPADYGLLEETISREPLAPLVRDDDAQFFDIVRWTVFALISAEELGVTSANADAMRNSANADIRRLLGTAPGNGKALGLGEDWAYDAIKTVGNYGELFERNVGRQSPLDLDRGLNRLSRDGGLMYAPPLR